MQDLKAHNFMSNNNVVLNIAGSLYFQNGSLCFTTLMWGEISEVGGKMCCAAIYLCTIVSKLALLHSVELFGIYVKNPGPGYDICCGFLYDGSLLDQPVPKEIECALLDSILLCIAH